MRNEFPIRPLAHGYRLDQAPLNATPLAGQWPCVNVRAVEGRVARRWDSTLNNTFGSGEIIQAVPIYRTNTGEVYTLVLTENDVAQLLTGTGETYTYLTDSYDTGTISAIVGAVVTGSGTSWLTSGIDAGDKFILDVDEQARSEPNTIWAEVASVDIDTQITLTAAYTGTTGAFSPGVAYRVRRVYSVPSGERWQWANVAGKFCFVNGFVPAQYWDSTLDYATDLNLVYANQVRYCTAYANRLVVADVYDPDISARNPWLLRWSANGTPTDFTDTTAGFNEFIDSEEPIMGLGTSGVNLIVFKRTSFYVGYQTGNPTSPIEFPTHNSGAGLASPHGIIKAAGTLMWLGIDDFYALNGDAAVSIGGPVKKKFFDMVSGEDLTKVWGMNNVMYNEACWVADTDSGQVVFVYNWKENQWYSYTFDDNITGFGWIGG